MFQALASFNWAGLILLILLWMFIVTMALWMLDRLFPRIERSRDDRVDMEPTTSATIYATHPGQEQHASGNLKPGRFSPQALGSRSSWVLRDTGPPTQPTPDWLTQYWGSSQKIISVLLAIWLLSLTLPVAFAPALSRVRILTGFPLGYFLVAQATLMVFMVLSFIYVWRMSHLDQRYCLRLPPMRNEERIYRRKLLRYAAVFIIGVLLIVLILSACEIFLGLPASFITWSLVTLSIGTYVVIGVRSGAHTLNDYYVAGRRIPGLFNGLAIASEWISGAAFVSMAGTLWLLGYEGLAYIVGWAGGYVLIAMLLAPHIRKSGRYTIADFIGSRYEGTLVRIIAAVLSITISFTYMTVQIVGFGIILNHFLDIPYTIGVSIGIIVVLFCSFTGGMKSITWTQVVQSFVVVIAFVLPVIWMTFKFTYVPVPPLMYGEVLEKISVLEVTQGIAPAYTEPFNDWTSWNFIALVICLMLGTASMPQVLTRFYTVPTVRESRSSAGWALVFVCIIYFVMPAYAAFSRWEILHQVLGQPTTALPDWIESWLYTDLLTISDTPSRGGNGDGYVQFDEIHINEDLIMLTAPEIAGMPATMKALVAVGGLAAALSTASGLLLVIASSTVHDLYYRSINPRALPRERLLLVRIVVLVTAILVALTALPRMAIIAQLVAWAFSFAAATMFPTLVLGIFWKGANARGAIAGMMSGAAVTASYMVLNYVNPEISFLGISHNAAGIFGVPMNFFLTWIVSCLGPSTSPRIQVLVDDLRHP